MQVHVSQKTINAGSPVAHQGEICTHVLPKWANSGGNHQATAFKCPARQKAQADAWKEKAQKSQNKKRKQPEVDEEQEDRLISKSTKMELDTNTNWAKSPKKPS